MTGAAGRPPRSRWTTDLAIGMRMAVGGASAGWVRLLLIATGVGLGVMMLLLVASIPTATGERQARADARSVTATVEEPGQGAVLTEVIRSGFRDQGIEGRLLQPEGPVAPLPPGVDRSLAPGEIVVSPALRDLMSSVDGQALRGRWGDRVVGTIGPEGLTGPRELTFYLGTDQLDATTATRVEAFGGPGQDSPGGDPTMVLLGLVGLAVFLVPVMSFIATAVRFGGEARDRRLAAVRLAGADPATARRMAAGETLVSALAGLVVGGVLFLVARPIAAALMPPVLGFYPQDLRPAPVLVLMVGVLIPVASVLVTMSALRRVVVEPLGVVRRATVTRRRLWWRLLLPVVGLGLLHPVVGGVHDSPEEQAMVVLGVVALLVGVPLMLPWVVEAVVHRLGGGGVAWELAVRRLQLESGAAVRAVSAIVVSVAGLVAVQGVVSGVVADAEQMQGERSASFQAQVLGGGAGGADAVWLQGLTAVPGVRDVATSTSTVAHEPATGQTVGVWSGTCAVLEDVLGPTGCADGDVVVVAPEGVAGPEAGTELVLGEPGSGASTWAVPSQVRTALPPDDPYGMAPADEPADAWLFLTPAALADGVELRGYTSVLVALDRGVPDAVDHLRTAVAQTYPRAYVSDRAQESLMGGLGVIQQVLRVGTAVLLTMVGASLLVNVVEQLRERRRLLAVLAAFGVRRRTLGLSVLWQVALPVVLGLTIAVGVGVGLGAALQAATRTPLVVDWGGTAVTAGAAAAVVLLTTAASLPLLYRLSRAEGLRAE
ncbi:ABC transporter permease [Cellulomonas bogoriensis]|uniref:Membrane protein n=1 Tax=Cellulomonas bogoriensis 69B4 = DSM 16987 TaxID=1386082 RepID=A0A0A0BQ47_9CELL|nr:ABC transporter permease [Cellulomonas bogoriensis]KGM10090.1 membrane protein [Cellulomonas bogoriensis 69B4 = DSM 16987]